MCDENCGNCEFFDGKGCRNTEIQIEQAEFYYERQVVLMSSTKRALYPKEYALFDKFRKYFLDDVEVSEQDFMHELEECC